MFRIFLNSHEKKKKEKKNKYSFVKGQVRLKRGGEDIMNFISVNNSRWGLHVTASNWGFEVLSAIERNPLQLV